MDEPGSSSALQAFSRLLGAAPAQPDDLPDLASSYEFGFGPILKTAQEGETSQ